MSTYAAILVLPLANVYWLKFPASCQAPCGHEHTCQVVCSCLVFTACGVLPDCSSLESTRMGFHHFCKIMSLKILFIHFYKGEEGEREGEKHQCVVAS